MLGSSSSYALFLPKFAEVSQCVAHQGYKGLVTGNEMKAAPSLFPVEQEAAVLEDAFGQHTTSGKGENPRIRQMCSFPAMLFFFM